MQGTMCDLISQTSNQLLLIALLTISRHCS